MRALVIAEARGEPTRVGRRFVDAMLFSWLAMTMLIDPMALQSAGDGAWSAVVRLRVLGAAAILGVRLVFMRGVSERALAPWLAAVTAMTAGLAAVIAARVGPAAPYAMTPILWCLIATIQMTPGTRLLAGLGAASLLSFAAVAAVTPRIAGGPPVAASIVMAAGVIAAIGVMARRHRQLEHDLFESRRLGRYRLMSPIGRGGMNEVWLAWDESRRREVALKLLPMPGAAEQTRRRFEREAELVRRVRSPHTVRIFDCGVTPDGFAYIALDYLRGMDLDALVCAYGPVEPRRAMRLMRQACTGLGAAHDVGVIHRDIKPANLHCSDANGNEDFLHILDFGVARTSDATPSPFDGTVMGTPAFMSPEAFRGADTTPASDVYSLGATFYFALTGALAVDAESSGAFHVAHLHAPIVPPSLRASTDVPRVLERIILRCLAKNPEDRFPDANAVGAALDAALAGDEAWSRQEAARWWHRARLGRVAAPVTSSEHTTDVGIVHVVAGETNLRARAKR